MAIHLAGLAALFSVAQGARFKRSTQSSTTQLGGVLVRNYRAHVEEWIIALRPGVTDSAENELCGGKCGLMGHPDEGGTGFVKLNGDETTLEEVLRKNADIVEFAEPDDFLYMIPEDNTEESDEDFQASTASWGLERVGVPSRPANGAGVNIYVQDTGVRVSHTDFGGRAIPTLDLTNDKLDECNGNKACAGDKQGHGTHCSGTAGGTSYGVASGAKIRAVKSLSDQGSGKGSWQIGGIDWVAANAKKPAVLSMSLGAAIVDPLYETSIGQATARGITVVVAAGNSRMDSCRFSPAYAASAITVGATTSRNQRAGYSNYGSCNNIMAPGSSITSAWSGSDSQKNTISGTSMACPHVSGGAAILLQGNPALKRDDIMSRMDSSGKKGFIKYLASGDPDLFLWVGS